MRLVHAALACAFLYGCAPNRVVATESAPASLAPGQSTIVTNVRPGRYFQFESPLPAVANESVELTLIASNDDVEWAPMSSLCVRGAAPSAPVCLKFSKKDQDSQVIYVHKEVIRSDGKALLSGQDLGKVSKMGEKITVNVRVDANAVHFSVNGFEPISHPLTAPVEAIRFACSGAVCSFRLL